MLRPKKHIFLRCNASNLVLKILQHDKIWGTIPLLQFFFGGGTFPRHPVIYAHGSGTELGNANCYMRMGGNESKTSIPAELSWVCSRRLVARRGMSACGQQAAGAAVTHAQRLVIIYYCATTVLCLPTSTCFEWNVYLSSHSINQSDGLPEEQMLNL